MTATKKRFGPLGSTAPTAGEPIRPDADPFLAPETVVPEPRERVKPHSHDASEPQSHDSVALRASDVTEPELNDAEAALIQKFMTPRRRDAVKEERVAFTWRISLDQADLLDGWARDFRRKLGRGRLDRSELLAAIVDVVSQRPDVLDAVGSRLTDS